MFPSKKSLAAAFSLLLLAQQVVSAFPIAAALQRDALRFNQVQEEEATALSAASLKRLEKFNDKTDSSWQIRMNSRTGTPRALVNGNKMQVGRSQGSARSFIKKNKDFLGVDASQLELKLERKSPIGTHFYFDQYYKGLKVENAYVKVNVDNKGNLLNYQSTFVDNLNIDTNPKKSAQEAAAIAEGDVSGKAEGSAVSIIYADQNKGTAVLAWQIPVTGSQSEPGKWIYYIDANTGVILNRISKYMYAQETFQAKLYPVYPGFAGQPKATYPMPNMDVYYFNGATPSSAKTNAQGQVDISRTGRAFAAFSGDFFTVTDQRQFTNPNGYYVEVGAKTDSGVTTNEGYDFSYSAWQPFTVAAAGSSPIATYEACAAGEWPFFATPQFAGSFSVGDMTNDGVIAEGKKVFLGLNITGQNKTLAKYIGKSGGVFDGPIVPNTSTSQTLSYGLNPSTAPASEYSFAVDRMYKLCAPTAFKSGFSALTTHTVTGINNNDDIANVYYNLNVMKSYFDTLNAGNYINISKHIPVMINAYGYPYSFGAAGMMNAFYDIDQNTILFGQGYPEGSVYKTFALENSIVRHEYVHAVMNNIWPILYYNEGAAIAEAVSDYFALSSLVQPGTTTPYTSEIGSYVAYNGGSGESTIRNLSGSVQYDAAAWTQNGINGQHKNSLVLSQALWQLRTNAPTSAHADEMVWTSLMFFPDSLLEFRDAMITVAKAKATDWGADYTNYIEAAFDAHKINYASIITANGDIYEPNNAPESAAELDGAALSSKQLSATINPASDIDFYALNLPEGEFEVTMHLPVAPNHWPTVYLPLTMFLLDANLKTVVDFINPSLTNAQYDIITQSENITLKYTVPALLAGGTGRYLLGVTKHIQGYYPANPTADTGAYRLDFKFAKGSTVGGVTTVVENFNDGLEMNFNVKYNVVGNISNPDAMPPVLQDWKPNNVEEYYSARLLDEGMKPITGADTITGTYLVQDTTPTVDTVNKTIAGKVKVAGNFAQLNYNTVYLQIFGKLRSSVSGENNPDRRPDYGVVSLGISEPIRSKASTGMAVYLRRGIFNPTDGSKINIEINPQESGTLKIQIFTVDGLLVKDIVNSAVTKGMPEYYQWDGRNGDGKIVASGVYLMRLDGAGMDKQLKKIVVVK